MAEQKIVIRLNKASSVLPPEMPAKIEEERSWNIPRVVAFLIILGILLLWLFRGIFSITPENKNDNILAEKLSKDFVAPTEEKIQPEAVIDVVSGLSGVESARYPGQANDSEKIVSGDTNKIVSDLPEGVDVSEREIAPQSGVDKGALAGEVTRAQFTRAVRNHEPVDSVSSPVHVSPKKAVTLSFFTRLEGMGGEVIRHRWQHDDRIVAEIKFDVESDSYPVYSSKYLNDTMVGKWRVVVLNKAGVELNSEEILVVDK